MKKIGKISLHQLDKAELSIRDKSLLIGGGDIGSCRCGSCSSTGGMPSQEDNRNANSYYGYYITGDYNVECACFASHDALSIVSA